MKKLYKQILTIVVVIALFLCFDISIYNVFTKRVNHQYSEGMQAKSVNLNEYLPFDDASLGSKIKGETLTGELPVIDGAAALYPVFASYVNALYPEDSISFNGKDFDASSKLQMNNTTGAYQRVVDGQADIVFCARSSKEQEDYAKRNNVELEYVPIGKESFVFLVNKRNKIDSLTIEQVKDIYSGKYNYWDEVGGDHIRIGALQRNEGSGSQSAMLRFMGDTKIVSDKDQFLGSAIGYSFRYYVSGMVQDSQIKMLALNGIYPSIENIKNDTYPIVNNFYAVYRKDNKNPNIKRLIDYILSSQGQEIIEECGYVGL